MALVPNCPPDLRIYKSNFDHGLFSRGEQSEHRSRLLHKIRDSYRKALERLNLRARPGMAARFLDGGGFCLGLLDPVSNIVANTLISYGRAAEPGGELVYVPEEKLRDLERRSLDGLVTFLTRFFPYLPDCHAVRFLLLADADLMVAFRIVALDLGISRIGSDKPAFDDALGMAFKCAAMAAKHPNPDQFLCDWLAISSRLHDTARLVHEVQRRSPLARLDRLAKLLDGLPRPVNSSCLSAPFLVPDSRPRSVPYLHSSALKGTLEDAIHGFYLKAIARLPAGELRSRLHRSLLVAGYCYGPLDPVSNIIINTIWYDAAFPPTVKLEVDVIGTMILHRTENCSLYGLVSFLTTRCHLIDFNQAIRCLLQAHGNLLLADHRPDAEAATTSLERAFFAAATAAHHPNPDAQAKFLHSCPSQRISVLLQGSGQLSSEDVQCLARLLCPEAACSEQPLQLFPRPWYLSSQTRMSKKINAALSTYAAALSGGPKYELHTICGVNQYVSGPVGTEAKCYRTHVNFLATPKGTQFPTGTAPLLFFAEVYNGDDEDRARTQPFVCHVSVPLPCAGRVRCLYCDHMGIRIVHPVAEDFHGRKLEFEKMVRGEDPCDDDFDPAVEQPYYTNMKIIDYSIVTRERLNGRVEEDRLYNDPLEGEYGSDPTLMSDEHGSDLTLMSDEYGSDLDYMADDDEPCHVSFPMVITSCCRVY